MASENDNDQRGQTDETFIQWLTGANFREDRQIKIVYLLVSIISLLGLIYGFSHWSEKSSNLEIVSIFTNLIVVALGLILVSKPIKVEISETLRHNSDLKILDETHIERGNKLSERFRRYFVGFLRTVGILYLFMFVDYSLDTYGVSAEKVVIHETVDSLTSKFKNEETSLHSLDTATKITFFKTEKTKQTITSVISHCQNLFSSIYENNVPLDIVEIGITLLNNIGIAWIYACFWVLFKNSLDKDIKESSLSIWPIIGIVIFFSSLHVLARVCGEYIFNHIIYTKIHRLFKIVSGMANAIMLSLFVSKFNARHFRPQVAVLILLFTYAIFQTLFCMFDYIVIDRKYAIMDITMFVCLFGKTTLILYVYWLMRTNRLFYYFISYPRTTGFIEQNWKASETLLKNTN
jgi:hypothetical protein